MPNLFFRHLTFRIRLSVLLGIVLGAAVVVAIGCSASSGGTGNKLGPDGIITGVGGSTNPSYNVCPNGDCSNVTVTDNCDGGAMVNITAKTGSRDLLAVNTGCTKVVNWGGQDAAVVETKPPPPLTEDYKCPSGTTRVHVRDVWSAQANPTLNKMPNRPIAVVLVDTGNNSTKFSLRQDSANCDWYSACLSLGTMATHDIFMTAQAAECAADSALTQIASGFFTLGQYSTNSDVWIDYNGAAGSITGDYGSSYVTRMTTGSGHFRFTANQADVQSELCPTGAPDSTVPADMIKLHIRWAWGNPDVTGFPGTACENYPDNDKGLGISTPPYPTSLQVNFQSGCSNALAMLDLQNSDCPWYTVLVPTSVWNTPGQSITVKYNGKDYSAISGKTLSPNPATASEYWLAFNGSRLDKPIGGNFGDCSLRFGMADKSFFYNQNPGPGYQGCGGGDTKIDPCNPPMPSGYSPVHFRYLWAGQKTFTYFPKPEFMPKWIVLRVMGSAGTQEITCFREADRPWFNCAVPNDFFTAGATWIAADLTRTPTEWNTVMAHPFPSTPGEYWIRWTYGKPDYSESAAEDAKKFTVYTFYPDGIGGDFSAVGNWGDGACAPKPAANTGMKLGYGGWFPYDETKYVYPYGASLARTYPAPDIVQQLLNYMVQERYEFWRDQYIETQDRVCGPDTARVAWRDSNSRTVSEGQGYGMAISAAIGDKPTFDKLWNFVRHFLSQGAKKYCGGLMGWNWDGSLPCRPLDSPCDIDKETCDGNADSAFDGDVDIGIGLVYAAMQWPEYRNAAVSWLIKMECEVNSAYDGKWNYGSNGDTANKDCSGYPGSACKYTSGSNGPVLVNYYPPGYFRVFGDFLQKFMDSTQSTAAERQTHHDFWYKTASTVYELLERCYDQAGVNPALTTDSGTYTAPCSSGLDNYNWARYMWRVGIDAAWFGNRQDFVENATGSSRHYAGKSEMEAKIDLIQDFFANFHIKNPVEVNANRFSSICQNLMPDGNVTNCDPGMGHNSYFVNTAMCSYVSIFDNDGKTTGDIRREALEEAVSTSIENNRYYQESIGVYTLLFLTGNFPNPLTVP